jgi:inner membrane transporter RhtA
VGLVLAAASSLQVGAAFAVTLFDDLGPAGAAFLRLAFAAVVLWAIWRPRMRSQPPRDLRVAAAFGVALGLMNWSIYESIDRIPLGVAVTIEFLGPLGVALAGSRHARDVAWVVLAGAGVALLTLGEGAGESLDPIGVALAGVAALCWGAYILLTKRVGARWAGLEGLSVSLGVAALVTLPVGVAAGGGELLAPEVLLAGIGLALLVPLLPYMFELIALRRLPTALFGVIMSLEPAIAALLGLLILDQRLALSGVAAIALVVVASAGATLGSAESPPRDEPVHCA